MSCSLYFLFLEGQAYDGTATIYLAKYLPADSYVAVSRTNLDAVHEGFSVLQVI